METKTISVDIPSGVTDNSDISLFGEGHLTEGSLPGDLVIRVKIQSDEKFQRAGQNLETLIPISFYESLTGFTREIVHLDGRKVPISKIGPTQFNEILKIQGEGMPGSYNQKGNLLCRIQYSFPEQLNKEQTDFVREVLSKYE